MVITTAGRRRDTFTFLVNRRERELIAELAKRLQRSQGDTLRFLVREAHGQLMPEEAGSTSVEHQPSGRV